MGTDRERDSNQETKEISIGFLLTQFGLDEGSVYDFWLRYMAYLSDECTLLPDIISIMRASDQESSVIIDFFTTLGMSCFFKNRIISDTDSLKV